MADEVIVPDVTPDVPPVVDPPAVLNYVPVYVNRAQFRYTEDGQPVITVEVTRVEDVEYAPGITLKTHLLQQQGLISELQANTATLANYVQDMSLFLTERFGYQYGDHTAADAFIPLFENVEKVPSVSDPIPDE